MLEPIEHLTRSNGPPTGHVTNARELGHTAVAVELARGSARTNGANWVDQTRLSEEALCLDEGFSGRSLQLVEALRSTLGGGFRRRRESRYN